MVTENVVDYAPLADRWTGEGRTHAGLTFTNPRRFNRATIAYPENLISPQLPQRATGRQSVVDLVALRMPLAE